MRPLKIVSDFPVRTGLSALALALATSIGVATLPAMAQSGPGAHHRAHGPAGVGMGIIKLRSQLNLTADQSAALDAIIAGAKSQGAALRASAQTVVAQINAELATPQPDLRVIAQLRDSLQLPRESLRTSVRDQLIGFYGTLNGTQQQVVIDALRKGAARHAEFAAKHVAP
ncbi:MAG: periplasmic heavy metal sensor [Betaproteobacteria bacterium]